MGVGGPQDPCSSTPVVDKVRNIGLTAIGQHVGHGPSRRLHSHEILASPAQGTLPLALNFYKTFRSFKVLLEWQNKKWENYLSERCILTKISIADFSAQTL